MKKENLVNVVKKSKQEEVKMKRLVKAVELVNAFYDYNYDTTSIAVKMENGKIEWSDGWFVNSPESTGRILEDRERFIEYFNINLLDRLSAYGIYTHTGKYHADDVVSANILYLVDIIDSYKAIQRIKTNEEANMKGLAFDICKGQFDHHQSDAKIHFDGNKSAACTLLAEFIYSKDKFNKIYNLFLKDIALTDNYGQGKFPNRYSHVVDIAYGLGYSFEEICKKMQEVVKAVIYENKLIWTEELEEIERLYKIKEREIDNKVQKFIRKHKSCILLLQEHLPAYKFKGSQIEFIVEKSIRDNKSWNIISVDSEKYNFKDMNAEGQTFVHSTGYMVVFDTFEHARKAILEYVEQKKGFGTCEKFAKNLSCGDCDECNLAYYL